jgi:(p)ppGpp synthase/HD superfamily hydrolase
MIFQERYKNALRFAASRHEGQKLPGTDLPYLVHVIAVAVEVIVAGNHAPDFNTGFAAEVALLHDTIEDTACTFAEVESHFGTSTANAVLSLTKFSNLPREEQIPDSIRRIKELEKEVWAVKLADRISNLDAPPLDWDYRKRRKYLDDAIFILDSLKEGNEYLAGRLKDRIDNYRQYVVTGDK